MDGTEVRAVIASRASNPLALLGFAARKGGLWELLDAACQQKGKAPGGLRIVIKPDLLAFSADSPTATDPRLVEALVDFLHDRGYSQVNLVASADSSGLWAENRDVFAIADLLGYRFATPKGRPYEVLDLSQDLVTVEFPQGALLHGSSVSQQWMNADFRIIFSKNKTDEADGYRLCLDSLIGILPLSDKDYYYRHRFNAADVVLELLGTAPAQFALIDAIVSSHGSGGLRAPLSISTNTLIASPCTALADFVGAVKMGVDPYVSRIGDTVFRSDKFPSHHHIEGTLTAYAGWKPVHPVVTDAVRKRERWVEMSRTLQPWIQQLDLSAFPLKDPIDARANEFLASRLGGIDSDLGTFALYVLANYGLGLVFDAAKNYQTLSAKDSIRQRHVPLGIDPATFRLSQFEAPLHELMQLRDLLRDGQFSADGLRWRYIDRAVLFEIEETFPVPFDEFIAAVDISKTIQFMNDYLGGTIVQVKRDAQRRPTHQAERNLYLPQPNYLVLTGGDMIDVTKLEYVQYSAKQHQMCWKTIKSDNGSATYDDGIITFRRTRDHTHVSIFGRQLFALPLPWQIINLDLMPVLKSRLVTAAYSTFFQRTFSNFEALLEGRDIYLGRKWHAPSEQQASEPLLREVVGKRVMSFIKEQGPLFARVMRGADGGSPLYTDALGFAHFAAPDKNGSDRASPGSSPRLEDSDLLVRQWGQFWTELVDAARRDVVWPRDGRLDAR
jgi:uncharacterized protein (DUF362 family)